MLLQFHMLPPKYNLFLKSKRGHICKCWLFCDVAYSLSLSLFLAILRYNWHITLCKFKVANMLIWYMYISWNHSKMVFLNFYLFFNFYFILFFNFTLLYWFCHISKWILHRYTCVPHPEPSSFLPPHTIPLGRPSAPAPRQQKRHWCIEQSFEIIRRC